ncbi:hypothetical protein [Candidatus Mycoplasma haematohominis]|uniref:Uncharacterized protein n=1 Tax=Candidatus Mycoplasma haematohominis TaxID=1494318 RepID=A0A478FP62_9MOLU|nr:hypothetical protein [Candidatus Mycoplasma haemohominis]GCE63091.1 hypothetical protein MHSWG343_00690 [Candidatus Mycoplasma haemohominis]
MPSPAAIGGGALGAGAISVGTAYAAGAFNKKDEVVTYANFGDYVNKRALTYIGDLEDETPNSIKKLLEEDKNANSSNGYRKKLQDKWDGMDAQGLQGENKDSITKPNEVKEKLIPSDSLNDLDNIAKFTKAWCKFKKSKTSGTDKKWTEDTIKKDADWKIFEEVCLIEKASQK